MSILTRTMHTQRPRCTGYSTSTTRVECPDIFAWTLLNRESRRGRAISSTAWQRNWDSDETHRKICHLLT